jgi:hypothetical protein
MSSRINALGKVSDEVRQKIDDATNVLGKAARHCNGWGILADVSETRGRISQALHDLRSADELLRGTSWPTEAEYAALEREHNRR